MMKIQSFRVKYSARLSSFARMPKSKATIQLILIFPTVRLKKGRKKEDSAEALNTPVHQLQPPEKPPRKVVAKVPVYRPDEPRNILNVKAGRFSDAVANEYEEYVRSKNPSVIAHVLRPETAVADEGAAPAEQNHKDSRPLGEKVISALVGIFSRMSRMTAIPSKTKMPSLLRIIRAKRTKEAYFMSLTII